MQVLAVTGWSGSGKTTMIVQLIREQLARGERVAAIKHTHHELNDRDEGDTARFRAAGASPVILAGDGEAVVFRESGTTRVRYGSPPDLLSHCDPATIVLVEGFKDFDGWPKVELPIVDRILGR